MNEEIVIWLNLLLACAFAMLGIGVVAQGVWIRRHVRHPTLVTVMVAVGAVVGVSSGLAMAAQLGDSQPTWQPYADGLEMLALVGLVALVLAMRRNYVGSSRTKRVLVVGAHPDDLELACGGTLARFTDHGHEVRAIVMSRGGRGGHPEGREREAQAGAETLDLEGISVHQFTDTKMATEMEEMVRVVELAVSLFKPDVIITHSKHDQHQDHHAVHLATLRAGRTCSTILCFESPSVTAEFKPHYFVDIDGYVDAKIAAVKAHAGQASKPYMGADRLRGAAVFRGSQAKVSHAEGFEVVRALSSGLGDL
jgi:LmbE family N-acetylglucosaminyl deacetylase